jgi:hypothetical protein
MRGLVAVTTCRPTTGDETNRETINLLSTTRNFDRSLLHPQLFLREILHL